ncbi:MAG TPA: hypothetical protein VNP90_10880 [Actinomycetota bacterium]|nr:hypothetical protein [Actinomycetota bacterium]
MRAIDLAYHVRAGELTLSTGEIVRTDPFTFTRFGLPWLNQQWGTQVVFASAHRMWGWAGVAGTYAAALGAGFSLLYRVCRRAGGDVRTASVLTILGFLVGASSLGARPQSLAVPLFTGTWLLLSRRDGWIWLVPLLAAVWANIHGSFVLAPVLVAFALGDDLVNRRSPVRSALIVLATIVATAANPFGLAVWSYVVDVTTNDTIRNTVAEWRPPSPLSGAGSLFWLSGIAVVAVGLTRRTAVGVMDVARLLVFFALGAAALRSTVWWALAAPPVVAGWLALPEPVEERHRASSVSGATVATAAIAVAILAAAFFVRAGTDPVTGAPKRLDADAPEVLVSATRRALPAGSRLLVFQPFASWFEYSLAGYPVMVDSRIEMFPAEIWRDYDTAIVAAGGWPSILGRHEIGAVILPPGAVLAEELRDDPGWTLEIDGAAGSLFVRG